MVELLFSSGCFLLHYCIFYHCKTEKHPLPFFVIRGKKIILLFCSRKLFVPKNPVLGGSVLPIICNVVFKGIHLLLGFLNIKLVENEKENLNLEWWLSNYADSEHLCSISQARVACCQKVACSKFSRKIKLLETVISILISACVYLNLVCILNTHKK